MKRWVWLCVLLLAAGGSMYAQDTAPATTAAEQPQIQNPPMNLQFDGALPASFRGGDPDSEVVHVLEDAKYQRQEHTLLYDDTPSPEMGAPAGSTFTGPPTINWTNEVVGADGTVTAVSNDNTNLATNESEFPEPGIYRVGNSGARQVSGAGGGATDADGTAADSGAGTGTNPDGSGSASGAGTGVTNPDGTAADAGAGTGVTNPDGTAADAGAGTGTTPEDQRVTSTMTRNVLCHDVTAPTVWAAFQEGAGTTQLAASESELKSKLMAAMVANKGELTPDALPADLQANLMAVYEFPRNMTPAQKAAAVTVKGPLFNKVGKDETVLVGTYQCQVLDQDEQTRLAAIGPKANKLDGVFVRRNIPFLAAAMASDNGDKYASAADAECYIEDANGNRIEKTDGAYLFRVPNFPRQEYSDQPEYKFIMIGLDKDGNKTEVKLPLYVVNTQVSFEGGQNQ